MITVSFINIKGGVAKTTSAIAFAQLLALEHGKNVLVLDCDKQANATLTLLGELPSGALTTSDLLTSRKPIADEAIRHTEYGVDIIPADFTLLEANRNVLFETNAREFRFARQLAAISDRYDYCIIDCPPDINVGVTNALYAADHVLIPIRADRYGLDRGLEYTFSAIEEAKEYNDKLQIVGCFLTMLTSRTRLSRVAREILAKFGNELAFTTSIRQSTTVGESTFDSPLISYVSQSDVVDDYRALLKEYLERTTK